MLRSESSYTSPQDDPPIRIQDILNVRNGSEADFRLRWKGDVYSVTNH